MTCKCEDCFILACFSRLSHVNWNGLCYTVFGLVLARPSQIKLIWFSDAALLFVVEWRRNSFFPEFFLLDFWVGSYNKTLYDWLLGKQWISFPLDLTECLGEKKLTVSLVAISPLCCLFCAQYPKRYHETSRWRLNPRPNDRNISTQHIATLLGATCCVRLATVLQCVAACWVLLAQV